MMRAVSPARVVLDDFQHTSAAKAFENLRRPVLFPMLGGWRQLGWPAARIVDAGQSPLSS
jgi:hypothetical protein